ncbi:MAG: hypothetical protein AB4038_21675 [Prochloraceae cyanobacterium]
MSRFLYERSVSHRGYLIIPFIADRASGRNIYSYSLLSHLGYTNQLHQAKNPAKLYSDQLGNIIKIAREHLDKCSLEYSDIDYFQRRYTYQNSLIILHQQIDKCFYDHYPPNELRNIAAPKLFNNIHDCIDWVKQGLDQQKVR